MQQAGAAGSPGSRHCWYAGVKVHGFATDQCGHEWEIIR